MRLFILVLVGLVTACGATVGGGGAPEQDETECDPTGPNTCPAGEICSADGSCVEGCNVDADCGPSDTCCDNECVDTSTDANSCGSCGNACGTGEGCCEGTCSSLSSLSDCGSCGNACMDGNFCDGTQCNAATYPNFCANKKVYVIHDGVDADNGAADLMASTITANCPADTMVMTASQTDATLVEQATGRPLAGSGVTYVLGGGPFPNTVLKYLERTMKITPIYFDAPDGINFYWRKRTDGSAAVTMPGSQCTTKHDQFIIELVTDPMSGTLSLIGYGACAGRGTRAAAHFYANVLLPNRMNYPDSWYVYDWVDTNSNLMPDNGDTFTVKASGK
jgi:hypothetical protein